MVPRIRWNFSQDERILLVLGEILIDEAEIADLRNIEVDLTGPDGEGKTTTSRQYHLCCRS